MDENSPQEDTLVEIFSRSIKETFLDIEEEDVSEAVAQLLEKANVKNFSEFIRRFKYRHHNEKNISFYKFFKSRKFKYRLIGELLGHSGQIDRVSFDNSSDFFFTASTDGMIKMWSVKSGLLVHSFIAHRSLVNDLCFSKDGKMMVSCDFFGTLNIWSLETRRVLINLEFHIGVDFCEFISTDEDDYHLVVILNTGILRTYRFDVEKILEVQENDIHLNELVKAICITDGGRFLLRGGYWPYLVVLDTHRPKECIILDTDGLPVHTLCASRDCLKFAAACGNFLYQWTFYVDGNPSHGNFNRTNKDLRGYWHKTVVEDIQVERMCYLRDNQVVCVCSDYKIRIYAGNTLRGSFDIDELGIVSPHPSENVFALCGSRIKFFYESHLVESIEINFNVTDCQFSDDGSYFIVGDDFGKARVFSLVGQEYPKALSEQFFPSDFDHINSLNENINMPCDDSKTVDSNRNVNLEWKKMDYKISRVSNRSNSITEALAFRHLEKAYIDKEKYNRKYGILTATNPQEEDEEDEGWEEDESSSSSEEDDEDDEEEEKAPCLTLRRNLEEGRFGRRRIILEETSSEERGLLVNKLRRNKVQKSSSSSEEVIHRRRRKKRNIVTFPRLRRQHH